MADKPFVEPIAPAVGALPIYDSDDVREVVPADYKRDEAPILDALIETVTEIALAWEDASSVAAAQSDMATASAHFLDGQGDDRDIHRAENEDQEAFRDRAITVPNAIDRIAILDAVNAILAPFTSVKAHLFDSILDRWFVTDGTAVYHSFVGASPRYLDRLYPSDAALNGGESRPLSEPGGAYAFSDRVGRHFVLRVPDISPIESVHAFVYTDLLQGPGFGAPPYRTGHRLFVGDGTQSVAAAFVSRGNSSALAVYQAIADKVNALEGHSTRWTLVVDPKLK